MALSARERFVLNGRSGLPSKLTAKLYKMGIDISTLTREQLLAYEKEFAFQEAMKPVSPDRWTVGRVKSKTGKYMRAYWKHQRMMDRLAKDCFDEIQIQIDLFYKSIPKEAWEDEEVKAALLDAIRSMRGSKALP